MTSQNYQSFLDEIAQQDQTWVVYINDIPINFQYLQNNEVWGRRTVSKRSFSIKEKDDFESDDDLIFLQAVDTDPAKYFDYMIRRCTANHHLIIGLAVQVSGKSADYICKKIFAEKIIQSFVDKFYTLFFPVYLKRHHSWFSIDLLVRAYTSWPGPFNHLMKILIKNTDISSQVLQDFVVNLKTNQCIKIIKAIVNIELTSQEFVYHLKTLSVLFLNSDKTYESYQFILNNLEAHESECYNNRDYGRLLLALANKLEDEVSQGILKRIIDRHGSEFKAPSLVAFHEVINNIIEIQNQMQGLSRFNIARPVDPGSRRN